MENKMYYDIENEEYVTEEELNIRYNEFLDDEDNEYMSFNHFVLNCLTVSGGTLEKVGF